MIVVLLTEQQLGNMQVGMKKIRSKLGISSCFVSFFFRLSTPKSLFLT